jgi:hypothetical protein
VIYKRKVEPILRSWRTVEEDRIMVKEEVRVSQVVVMEIGGTSTPDVEVVAMSRSMKVV